MALVASLRERLPEQAGNVGGLKRVRTGPRLTIPPLSGRKIVAYGPLRARTGTAVISLGVRHGEPGNRPGAKAPGTEYHSASASDSSDALPPTAVVFTDVVRSLTKRSR